MSDIWGGSKNSLLPQHAAKLRNEYNIDWDGNVGDIKYPQKYEVNEGKQKGVDGKACWDGYKRMGTKKKGGKTVDNCVPIKKKK